MEIVVFSNDTSIEKELLESAAECALQAIKKELPPEVLSYEVCKYVLQTCRDRLKTKKIVL